MRKLLRGIIRKEAESKGVEASKYLNAMWNSLQNKAIGADRRIINKAKGTHKKRVWGARIEAVLG